MHEKSKEMKFLLYKDKTIYFLKSSSSYLFLDCPHGYFWVNCSMMCEYPTFGKKCAQNCSCEKNLCNFDLGCPECKYCLFSFQHMYITIQNMMIEKIS